MFSSSSRPGIPGLFALLEFSRGGYLKTDHPSVHHTEIKKIQNGDEGGWEFICHSCGYRARYTIDRAGTQRLEILFVGDSHARHTSKSIVEDRSERQEEREILYLQDDSGLPEEPLLEEEDNWLTPEIRAQVEAIMKDFD